MRPSLSILVLLTILGGVPSGAATPAPSRPSLVLEKAPGDLGAVRGDGLVLLAVDGEAGSTVSLYDVHTRTLRSYAEDDGRLWDTVVLKGGTPSQPKRVRIHEGDVVVLDAEGVKRFGPDGVMEREATIFQPRDLVVDRRGYVVSLMNVPDPSDPDRFIGRDAYQRREGVPRLLVLDDDLEVTGSGLFMQRDGVTASAGAGRTLALASDGRRSLFAAEKSSYAIFELATDAKVRRILREPAIQREDPAGESAERATLDRQLRERADQMLAERGQDVGGRAAPARAARIAAGPSAIAFHNEPAINDVLWEPSLGRLLVLLHPGVVAASSALDLVDPATGDVRRFALFVPGQGDRDLNQLAVSDHYLWLRDKRGASTVYRVPLLELETRRGATYRLLEVKEIEAAPLHGE